MTRHREATERLLIRPFRASDQDAARQLILAGLGEHFGFIDETLNPDVDDIEAHYLASGSQFIVAEMDGILVGTAALVEEAPRIGRIVRLSTERGYRRLGIGRLLVDRLLQLAHQQGLHRILVETNHDWPEVVRFYESQGFNEYQRDQESVHLYLKLV
jgi:GNAT superfamily N-acetyltransferase